jgi:predicted DNA-binding protein YlxM (UPF0122 family)
MNNAISQFNFNNCSDAELMEWFQQAFPIMKEIYKRFCVPKQTNCQDCPQEKQCKQHNANKHDLTCLIMEPFLPGRHKGKGYLEKTAGLLRGKYQDTKNDEDNEDNHQTEKEPQFALRELKSLKKIRSDEQIMLYKSCGHLFTDKQWEVIFLRLDSGLKLREIGKALGISPSTASDRFRRAKRDMENFYRKKHEKSFIKKSDT